MESVSGAGQRRRRWFLCAGLKVDEGIPALHLSLHSVIKTRKISPTAKNKASRQK